MPARESELSDDTPPHRLGRLFVISGPSGVGKDAVLAKVRQFQRTRHFTVTATTRQRRPGEEDGVDYFFLSRKTFERMIEADELLEWAEVHGNLYGVPKSQVVEAQNSGLDVIIQVDVQGAATIKRMMPEATLIFMEPPDLCALIERLRKRNTESQREFALRLETARKELRESHWFDYTVVNHDGRIDEAAAAIDRIIQGRA